VVVDAARAIDPRPSRLTEARLPVCHSSKFLAARHSPAPCCSHGEVAATDRPRTSASREDINLGTTLRWIAALATIDAFEPIVATVPPFLERPVLSNARSRQSHARAGRWIASRRGMAALPTIFTLGVRDPARPERMLRRWSCVALRASRGTDSVGQPVALARSAVFDWRLAQDLLPASGDGAWRGLRGVGGSHRVSPVRGQRRTSARRTKEPVHEQRREGIAHRGPRRTDRDL